MLSAFLLSSGSGRWAEANLTIDWNLRFRIPSTNNCCDTKRSYAGVEGVCLDVLAHAISEGVCRNGGFVEAPPLGSLISCAVDEVSAVWEET
jgi:hypothetical protein